MEVMGCTSIVEGWEPGDPIPEGALLLSQRQVRPRSVPGLIVTSAGYIEDVLELVVELRQGEEVRHG